MCKDDIGGSWSKGSKNILSHKRILQCLSTSNIPRFRRQQAKNQGLKTVARLNPSDKYKNKEKYFLTIGTWFALI